MERGGVEMEGGKRKVGRGKGGKKRVRNGRVQEPGARSMDLLSRRDLTGGNMYNTGGRNLPVLCAPLTIWKYSSRK